MIEEASDPADEKVERPGFKYWTCVHHPKKTGQQNFVIFIHESKRRAAKRNENRDKQAHGREENEKSSVINDVQTKNSERQV